eukprot:gene9505-418_t
MSTKDEAKTDPKDKEAVKSPSNRATTPGGKSYDDDEREHKSVHNWLAARGIGIPEYEDILAKRARTKFDMIELHRKQEAKELSEYKQRRVSQNKEVKDLESELDHRFDLTMEQKQSLAKRITHARQLLEQYSLEEAAMKDHWVHHFQLEEFQITDVDQRQMRGLVSAKNEHNRHVELRVCAPLSLSTDRKDLECKPVDDGTYIVLIDYHVFGTP